MKQVRDWQQNRSMWIRVLEESTGEALEAWNKRIEEEKFADERSLRDWLSSKSVNGYAQTLLVMERFGYPDYITTSGDELIDAQYADRPQLRPIFDAIIDAILEYGDVILQTRKTYVSLVGPKRTFARVQPTTKTRVDLGLRLEGQQPVGRLQKSSIHQTMKLQIGLSTLEEFDEEVFEWLKKAYDENA
jgi:hypothetical protein